MKDVKEEIKCICYSNQKLFYGQKNTVQFLNNFTNSENFNPNDSILLTNFNSQVRIIEYNQKNDSVICASEDEHIHIINLISLDVFKYKSSHEGSLKNMKISPDGKYLLTTGCDGYICIYEIMDDGKIQMKKRLRLSQKVSIESNQHLGIDINEDNVCAIGGNIFLKTFKLNPVSLDILSLENVPYISHKTDISQVKWLNTNMIVSVDIDNQLKVWKIENNSQTCIFTLNNDNNILSILAYYNNNQVNILLADNSGNLNLSNKLDLIASDSNKNEFLFEKNYDRSELMKKLRDEKDNNIDNLLNELDLLANDNNNKPTKEDNLENLANLSDLENEYGELKNPDEIAQGI
jgi:WD40 repeat protein